MGRKGVGTVPDPKEFMQSDELRSEVSVELSSSDDGAYFICIGKSAAFPSYSENCLIGPFKLSSNQGLPPSNTSSRPTTSSQFSTSTQLSRTTHANFNMFMSTPIANTFQEQPARHSIFS